MATSGNPANSGLISNEALKFIDDNMAEDLAPRTSGNIEQLRKDIFDGFAPAAKRAIERNEVSIEEKAQAGVPYLEVLPSNCRDDRLIFYCFGGGFVTGSPYEDLPVSAALAKHTGARVVSLNYPMSPEHPWPAALNAAHSLYSAITAELTNARIALVGESAGGNLALALTQYLRSNGSSLPDVMALLSPWCDLTNQGDSLEFNRDRDPTLRFDPDMYASNAYAGDIPLDDPGYRPCLVNSTTVFLQRS